MKWYVTKIVFRIICGDGNHAAQFDEQLRLIEAEDEQAAFGKATAIGRNEEESFYNTKRQLVRWVFINVPDVYSLGQLKDGAELYSRINEVDDALAYAEGINRKAESFRQDKHRQLVN